MSQKLTLNQVCVIYDKDNNPQGFGPGDVEVTQEQADKIKKTFPFAITGPKTVVNEVAKETAQAIEPTRPETTRPEPQKAGGS